MKKILVAILLLAATSLSAETYVSFKGGFYFEYPENWIQVDYNTADLFLKRSASDPSSMEYEAVFAHAEASPFFNGEYLILKLDTLEWLYEYKEDSIIEDVERSLGQELKRISAWEHLADTTSTLPAYDAENKIILIKSDIIQDDRIVKYSVYMKKLHEKGVAEFYFFAPTQNYKNSKQVFKSIVMSFSTENVNQALPTEDLKVADLEVEKKSNRTIWFVLSAVMTLIIAIIISRKQLSKRKKNN